MEREAEAGLVTTIIPVFNRAELLAQAVSSVLEQTYRPIEILIVDDASTDETAATAAALAAAHHEVRVIRHEENRGVGAARESGRLMARGEFIQHLDSDDVLLPHKFELQVAGLRAHPECGASYGWTAERNADGTRTPRPIKRTGERIEAMFPSMLQSRWWHTPTPLYRATVIHAAGPWMEMSNEEDWEYDARMASLGVRLHYVPEWLCEVQDHEGARLSTRGLEQDVLRHRARAHALILEHARRAGISPDAPEMGHFARELFLLSRQCGAAGLPEESRTLFSLAREASGPAGRRAQFRIYHALARVVGWRVTGMLSAILDRLRPN